MFKLEEVVETNLLPDTPGMSLAARAILGAFGELSEKLRNVESADELALCVEAQRHHPVFLQRLEEESGQFIHAAQGASLVVNSVGEGDRHALAGEWVEPTDVSGLRPNIAFMAHHALFISHEGSYAHPYAAKNLTSPQVDLKKLAEQALMALMTQPRSHLPYSRRGELERLSQVLFSIVVFDEGSRARLRQHFQRMLSQARA